MLSTVTITLDPLSMLVWAAIGLIAGFVASKVMLGHGLGILADMVVGVIGGLGGGFLAGYFGVTFNVPGHPIISEMVIAFLGAAVLLGILRVVGAARPRRHRWARR